MLTFERSCPDCCFYDATHYFFTVNRVPLQSLAGCYLAWQFSIELIAMESVADQVN